MKFVAFLVPVLIGTCAAPVFSASGDKIDARKMFEKHCAACHPDGQNTINPSKPITKKSLNANGVKTAADIVAKMRKPGPGMPKFDAQAIPDKEAKAIANYILKTF